MSKVVEPFNLVGKLSGFVVKDGVKIKYLRINVSDREYWIKPPKQKESLMFSLQPESWLEITGIKKLKGGKLKLDANEIHILPKSDHTPTQIDNAETSDIGSILVCQKSDCLRRGSSAVCQGIAQSLQEEGLADRVKVRAVGCLKRCQAGPNVVLLPDKAYYSNVQPAQIPDLMKAHFSSLVTND